MNQPWLSVVLPTYNGASYLAQALDSIVLQQDPEVEVVAVDDGSTDETAAILATYAGRLPLQIVRRDHAGNWVESTNLGLSLARGAYACVLHQDDYWLPERLSVLKPLLYQCPEAVLALHPSWYVDGQDRRLGLWRCPLPAGDGLLPSRLVVPRLLVQNFIAMPAPIFRRQAALDGGGMRPHLWYTADWDLWLTLAAVGPIFYCPRPLACFRVHGQSQTIRSSVSSQRFRDQLDEVLDRHVRRWEEAHGELPGTVRRAAQFSVEMNTTLAAHFHGQRGLLPRLLARGLLLGPAATLRYLRDSRLAERASSRLRALATPRASAASRRSHNGA